jgi:hypothetical protein
MPVTDWSSVLNQFRGCSNIWNVLHRSLFGYDSSCSEEKLTSDLIKAGANPADVPSIIAEHRRQMSSQTIGDAFVSTGTNATRLFLFGAGIATVVYVFYKFNKWRQ